MHYGYGWMWGMSWVGWIVWVVVIVGLVMVVARPSNRNAGSQSTAREILDRRYAAGEISTAEYEERKARLAEK